MTRLRLLALKTGAPLRVVAGILLDKGWQKMQEDNDPDLLGSLLDAGET